MSLNAYLPLKGIRVLVVDDCEDARFLTAVILEAHGVEVATAVSASAAFDALKQVKPDLLICDIAMPFEDGYSFIRKVRAWEAKEGGKIPAIALTALELEEGPQSSLAMGFQIHLVKPVEQDELINAVQKLCLCPGKVA